MKVLVTGGHPAPALALIDAAIASSQWHNLKFVFVGRQFNNNREQSLSFEYQEITARKIPFHHLPAGRLTRVLSFQSIREMLYIPYGFIKAIRILEQEQPNVIMTFGGYLALPIALAGRLAGIPVYLHEQTIAPGIASKWISKIAKKVFISFPDERNELPAEKVQLTGNLVRDGVFQKGTLPFLLPKELPVVYITGGSLGSHSLNKAVETILPELLAQFTIIHQTGNMKEFGDFEHLSIVKQQLDPKVKERYIVLAHVPASLIGSVFHAADIIVSRSGANTVTELIALKKPAVLVPLPWSARNEQRLQANLLQKNGVAVIFEQDGLPNDLLEKIRQVYEQRQQMTAGFSSLSTLFHSDAATRILQEISEN